MSGYPSGRQLKAARAMAGLSLDALAAEVGISKHKLFRLERILDSGDLQAVLRALGARGVSLTSSGVQMDGVQPVAPAGAPCQPIDAHAQRRADA